MNRRGLLAGILAAGAAPVIVPASSLMKIATMRPLVFANLQHSTLLLHDHHGDLLQWQRKEAVWLDEQAARTIVDDIQMRTVRLSRADFVRLGFTT